MDCHTLRILVIGAIMIFSSLFITYGEEKESRSYEVAWELRIAAKGYSQLSEEMSKSGIKDKELKNIIEFWSVDIAIGYLARAQDYSANDQNWRRMTSGLIEDYQAIQKLVKSDRLDAIINELARIFEI